MTHGDELARHQLAAMGHYGDGPFTGAKNVCAAQKCFAQTLFGERIMHTPGPWEYAIEEDGGDNPDIAIVDKDGNIICDTGGGEYQARLTNARLIAAAPELLAELKKWLEWAKDEGVQGIESTKALIAKAEGK